ncbi:unnamed protein product [Anisakis simplex]|uniref:Lipoma HMGIC fusion partner-like protein n=1 Tax=Anisakis simplex TaxID=6269 RepID=A0A0M3J361_ANISI|nr:unnamed protein product [Anisakis simplex]
MNTGLTVIGYFWTLLSTVSTVCAIFGFYNPSWLIGTISVDGRRVYTYFGSFRRCNYPVYDKVSFQLNNRLQELSSFRLEERCGRYATFSDIPSIYWQISTICISMGCALSLLLTFILLASCCVKDIVTRTSALLIGLMQVVAGLFHFIFQTCHQFLHTMNFKYAFVDVPNYKFLIKQWFSRSGALLPLLMIWQAALSPSDTET